MADAHKKDIYPCPTHTVLVIEHPAKVKDTDKAIASVGGPAALTAFAEDPEKAVLALKFRPADRYEHAKLSSTVKTNNMVIRCRRRIDPITGKETLLQRPLARVKHTVRFRAMADFSLATNQSAAIKRFDVAIQAKDARVMANYEPEDNEEPDNDVRIDMPPAPVMSAQTTPIPYYYQQKSSARKASSQETGKRGLGPLPPRQFIIAHAFHDGPVPTSPSKQVFTNEEVLVLKTKLAALFEQEPIWTRRKLSNTLGVPRENPILKYALAHVAYVWRGGPWRDSYCTFGVDPRQDHALRKYQAIYFLHKPKGDVPQHDKSESHVFDGVTLYLAARTFALCDITDPVLVQIIQRATIRTECDPKDGWFRRSTINAVRHVLKEKTVKLCDGLVPGNAEFRDILVHADDPDPEETSAMQHAGRLLDDADDVDAGDDVEDDALDARIDTQLSQAFNEHDLEEAEFDVDFGSESD